MGRDRLTEPSNNLAWRVAELARKVERLEDQQPAVVADRVTRLSGDVSALRREVSDDMSSLKTQFEKDSKDRRDEIAAFRRVFVTTFSALGVTIAAAVVALIINGGGTP